MVVANELIIDNADGQGFQRSGSWSTSTTDRDGAKHGVDYLYDNGGSCASCTATWTPTGLSSGRYEVYLWWVPSSNRPDAVPVTIEYDSGCTHEVVVDQTDAQLGDQWNLLGEVDDPRSVTLTGADSGYTIADAVRFVRVGDAGSAGCCTAPACGADSCGVLSNGCGATLDCGGCDAGESCNANVCAPAGGGERVIDNADGLEFETSGSWSTSTTDRDGAKYGADYLYNSGSCETCTATWTPTGLSSGRYEVYLWWVPSSNRPDAAPVTIEYDSGCTHEVVVDQTDAQLGDQWNLLGEVDDPRSVTLAGADSGYVTADAVRFVRVGDAGSASCSSSCAPTQEVCDNMDNDCDGWVDEDLEGFCAPASRVASLAEHLNAGRATSTSCGGGCTQYLATGSGELLGQDPLEAVELCSNDYGATWSAGPCKCLGGDPQGAPSSPAEDHVWRMLGIVVTHAEMDWGVASQSLSLSPYQVARASCAMRRVPYHIETLGEGTVPRPYMDIIEVTEPTWLPMSQMADGKYHVGPEEAEVAGLLDDVRGQYDMVFVTYPEVGSGVAYRAWEAQARIGADRRFLGYTDGAHFLADFEESLTARKWVHEWLHNTESYYESKLEMDANNREPISQQENGLYGVCRPGVAPTPSAPCFTASPEFRGLPDPHDAPLGDLDAWGNPVYTMVLDTSSEDGYYSSIMRGAVGTEVSSSVHRPYAAAGSHNLWTDWVAPRVEPIATTRPTIRGARYVIDPPNDWQGITFEFDAVNQPSEPPYGYVFTVTTPTSSGVVTDDHEGSGAPAAQRYAGFAKLDLCREFGNGDHLLDLQVAVAADRFGTPSDVSSTLSQFDWVSCP